MAAHVVCGKTATAGVTLAGRRGQRIDSTTERWRVASRQTQGETSTEVNWRWIDGCKSSVQKMLHDLGTGRSGLRRQMGGDGEVDAGRRRWSKLVQGKPSVLIGCIGVAATTEPNSAPAGAFRSQALPPAKARN